MPEVNKSNSNKLVVAVLLFLVVGFLMSTFTSYTQNSDLQTGLESRKTVGDEILRLTQEHSEELKVLKDEMQKLKNNCSNTGNNSR